VPFSKSPANELVCSLLFGCYRDTSNEEQRLAAIRRIDFSWVIEKDDAKRAKKAAEADTAQKEWPWQGLVESLQQAQQELSVVIDLIGTVGTCVHSHT
jgi:mediator of RNA polymerase II transcription subunit 17